MKLKNELEQLRYKLGIWEEIDASYIETEAYRQLLEKNMPLPKNVLHRNPDASIEEAMFSIIKKTELTDDELAAYLQYKQLDAIITIKKCVVFFTVLTVISLICGLILAMSMM